MNVDLETRAANMAREQIADGTWVSGATIADQLGVQRDSAMYHWVALAATRVHMSSQA